MTRMICAFFFLSVIAYPLGVLAQSTLTLDGEVAKPVVWTIADLRSLNRATVKVKTASGGESLYEGVPLSDLLTIGKVPIKQSLKGSSISLYLHAEGRDGFAAVFSLPEFDSGKFLVADRIDGKDLPAADGPVQIISPDESRHSRWIKQLQTLRIKRSSK